MLLTLLSALAAAQPEAPNPPTIYPQYGEESVLTGELGCADVVDCPPRAGFVPFARLQLGQFWLEDEDAAQYMSAPTSSQGNLFSVFTEFGRTPPGKIESTNNPSANQNVVEPNAVVTVMIDDPNSQSNLPSYIYYDVPRENLPQFLEEHSGGTSIEYLDANTVRLVSGYDTELPAGVVDVSSASLPNADDFSEGSANVYELKIRETIRFENVEFSLQHLYDDGWVNSHPAWRLGANGWGMNLDVGQLPMPTSTIQPKDPSAGCLRRWLKSFNHAYYVSYGVRTVRVVDEIEYDFSLGGPLDDMYSHTRVDQTNIGPQLTIGRTSRSGRWLLDLSGTVLVGYGHARFNQFGHFGDNIRPTGSPFQNRASEDFLATYAELDFTTSYFLTSHWTLDLTARAFVLGEHFSAEDHIVWSLPDFGIEESKQSHSYAGGNLFVGASYVW